ncbi:divalent metal cation transporter [Patescibacteria group bacterium]|nr:divalent metal cation transporter [Patescibacteria group bacterium]
MARLRTKLRRIFRIMGPGIITGAADDDPSGIATYSQTGAQFGYGQLWTAIFMLPIQTAVQEACARIGAVTGKGIAAVVREHYGRKILTLVVLLVLLANTVNIGADIGAMAAAASLIIPVKFTVWICFFTALILVLEIFTSYRVYARILKWLCLSLIAYPLTVFIVTQPWPVILRATFVPHIELSFGFLFIITGVLGTTISPYMFFWQASEETEEERAAHMTHRDKPPSVTDAFIRRMRTDNLLGMIFSEIGTWAIIVVSATVLNSHGITTIRTAAEAAQALEPLVQSFPDAGYLAKLIFAAGIIGLGLLSIPVLAGSAAYALSESFGWREGLNLKVKRAHGFYGVITIATVLGLCINFIGIDPIRALVFTAVINGLVAVPLIFLIWRIAQSRTIMGKYRSGILSNTFVLLAFLGMTGASLAMLLTFRP